MTKLLLTTAAALCGLVSSSLVVTQAQATTYSNVAGQYDIGSLGYPNTTAYGEEFVAPDGTLQSWSFTTDGGLSGNVGFVIAKWNGSEAVGPALYTGTIENVSAGPNNVMTWSNIDLSLTAGREYIAFLTAAGVVDPTGGIDVKGSNGNGGLGGEFYYLNNNGVNPLASPATWSTYCVPDMEFPATFTPTVAKVPEPVSIALLGAGVAGLGLVRRKSPSI